MPPDSPHELEGRESKCDKRLGASLVDVESRDRARLSRWGQLCLHLPLDSSGLTVLQSVVPFALGDSQEDTFSSF
ncbi:hypothetical protein PM082_009278 [Marasmius tenuissimus]|nr:hypothetical protein PM082_009278 [Marasmius tenuissimus]